MIDPVVRRAAPHDVDDLRDLEALARAALVDQRGGQRWLEDHPPRAGWDALVGDPARVVLVGTLDEVVIGYLVVELDGRVARVTEVFVHPGAREVGYGDALLAAAVEAATASGAELLEGEALPGDRDVKNLYERAGITARLIVVSTRLPGARDR